MKIFIDSADINEISELCETNLINGVTTNPSLINVNLKYKYIGGRTYAVSHK